MPSGNYINKTNFHTLGFYTQVGIGGVDVQLNGIQDQILTLNGSNQFILPAEAKIKLGYGGGVGMSRLKINTPQLRLLGLPYIQPINITLAVPSPPNIYLPGENGPTIPRSDALSVQSTNVDAAAQFHLGLMWFDMTPEALPSGQEYHLRFTAAITQVAGSWVNGTLTPDSTLPAGIYAITGMQAFGTNLAAARLVMPGGGWRPGCLAANSASGVTRREFVDGYMGVYGYFDSINIPNLDVLGIGAGATQEVYLDCIRVGNR
jgi:hypothetical protein